MLEGDGGQGRHKRLVLAPEKEKALKGFPRPPGVTETKANLSDFRNLVVHDDQLYSGRLQHSKKPNHRCLKGCRVQSEHTGRNLACLYLLLTLCLLISHLQVLLENLLLSTVQLWWTRVMLLQKKLKLLTLIRPWRDWEALPFLTFWLRESR